MKNLSQSDMTKILKDWDGSFQIVKTGGHIVTIHVSQSYVFDEFPDIEKLKKRLIDIYPFEYKTEVDISDRKYIFRYSIRITRDEMNAFLRKKEALKTIKID